MTELWRRIVFSIMISNTDDHLRNHGFVYERHLGWRLSPAYDMNPVPAEIKQRVLTTAINLDDGTASLELALSVADDFRISNAKAIIREVATAVSQWRDVAKSLGLAKREIDRMGSAFEHDDLKAAQKF
jgi:serine/threonine-protein kinase HipA